MCADPSGQNQRAEHQIVQYEIPALAQSDRGARRRFGSRSLVGAMSLHALRRHIGDDAFFRVLHDWVGSPEGEPRTTQDFVERAESVSGQQLGDFFQAWLYTPGRVGGGPCDAITVPGKPRALVVRQSSVGGEVGVNWKLPVDSGGSKVTYYSVYVDGRQIAGTWARGHAVTIPAGTITPGSHEIGVRALNSVGAGEVLGKQFRIS